MFFCCCKNSFEVDLSLGEVERLGQLGLPPDGDVPGGVEADGPSVMVMLMMMLNR